MIAPRDEVKARNKRETVREHINQLIDRLGPGARLPGVREFCQELDVSLSTVNGALAELEADQRIIRRQGSGIFVAPDLLRRRIALVCDPEFFYQIGPSPFWGILLRAAQTRAAEHNEELFLRLLPLDESFEAEIAAGRIHGIVGIGLDDRTLANLQSKGVPSVGYAGPGDYYVGLEPGMLSQIGATALARQGCRRIGLWRKRTIAIDADFDHFLHALAAHELPYHPSLSNGAQEGDSGQERGYYLARRVFGEPRYLWPDGIVIDDDMLTLGAMGAFHELGIELEHDVRIATHANAGSPVLRGWQHQMTLLEVDPAEIVDLLFSILESVLSGTAPSQHDFYLSLRVRPASGAGDA